PLVPAALQSTDQSPKQHLQSAHFRAYIRQHPVKLLADFFPFPPGAVIHHKHLFPILILTHGNRIIPVCNKEGSIEGLDGRGGHPGNLKGRGGALAVPGKEVAGRVRRQFHPVIVKFFFLHQAAKVDPVRGKIPLYLFGKNRVGCHQIECCLIRAVQLSAPPAHRGQLGYQRFIPFRMV
ncbi:NADH peroxidase, partial [Dysosmobacter welbionis]